MSHTKIQSDLAIPPGEYLAEVMTELKISKVELANRMNLQIEDINALIKGRKILTIKIAKNLANFVGVPVHVWLGLESEYRKILNWNDKDISIAFW